MKNVAAILAFVIAAPSMIRADEQPRWQATLGDLAKTEKADYGGLCGIVVDPAAGTMWINLSDRGFYRSDDQAKTFTRCGDKKPKGRTESPGCLLLDPTGKSKRMAAALVYGSPISGGRAALTARSGPTAPRRCRSGITPRCTGWWRAV